MRLSSVARLARIILSLALLVLIFVHVGPSLVLEQVGGMERSLLVMAFVLLLAEALVRALNWYQLIRNNVKNVSLRTVVHAHFVGGFFGALLPSTLGTDVARSAVMASRSTTPVEAYFATTVLLNVLSLAVISAAALIACTRVMSWPDTPLATIAVSAAVSAACLLAIFAAWARARSMQAPPAIADVAATGIRARLRQRFAQFVAALLILPRGWNLAGVALVAALSYALRSLGWLVLLAAVGAPVSWLVLLTIGPLLTLGAALPVSVLGFGGFQAINVLLLVQWGVPPQHALAMSLVQSGLAVLLHAVGCFAYVGGDKLALPAKEGSAREKFSG
jgi:glycosyltransferase 2 family protein